MATFISIGGIETLLGSASDDDYVFGNVSIIDRTTLIDSGGVDRFIVTYGTNSPQPATSGEFINTGTHLIFRALGGKEIIMDLDANGQSEVEYLVWRAPNPGTNPDRVLTIITDLTNIVGENIAVAGTSGNDVIIAPTHAGVVPRYSEIYANAGDDRVTLSSTAQMITYGGTGNDTITGTGTFDDVFRGDEGQDQLRGAGGNDRINGNRGSDSIFGDAGNDSLFGDQNGDLLVGGTGIDALDGGSGKDDLTGGRGSDFFVFTTAPGSRNADSITDFNVRADTVQLEGSVFTRIGDGAVSAGEFHASKNGNAADRSDRLLYDTDSGQLFYDRDGSGAANKVLFAELDPGLRLTSDDFFVI